MPLPSLWSHLETVQRLLQPPSALALFTDIDGTISPIVPVPEEGAVTPRCRAALERLASRLPLVGAVSGRAAAHARAMVGLDGLIYLGNHGLERWPRSVLSPPSSATPEALADLAARLAGLPGLRLEDKGPVVGVHYRLAPDPEQAREQALSAAHAVAARYGLRVAEGRRVVELRPAVEVNKGTALRALLDEHPDVRAVLYLGDDRTDADAFRALHRWAADQEGRVAVALAVLSPETPPEVQEHADYALEGVGAVERFLEWLARVCQIQAEAEQPR
ncbi:MAG: trehalose-phosphatase [Chloroflexi bacterium]|nr:trehalose-phosphatase [Chloroflexota bacterium]